MGQLPVLDLVVKLCTALAAEEISYCHWKSNTALDRSASGDNDLDLLVNRAHAERFTRILYRLGFKETLSPSEEELPGVRDYYGYDFETGRLVHVHVHFQLIFGNDLSKNYRLPLEKVYLKSSIQDGLFRVPAPEFELVIFVIRMVLKHSTWDSILMRQGHLSPSERQELGYLSAPDVVSKAQMILQYVPGLSTSLFNECLHVLQPGCSLLKRIRVGEQLQKVLQSSARRPHLLDILVKFLRRLWWPVRGRIFRSEPKNRMASGGLFIAVVGGDGAGKTTLINELDLWLSEKFEAEKLHMGKPRWSWATIVIRGILKMGTLLRFYPFEGDVYEESNQLHGLPWFFRAVCTGRDRHLTYLQARRSSSNGSLVLCDRYPFPDFMKMDGPQCKSAIANLKKTNRFLEFLSSMEEAYYQQIKQPDLLIVLKLNPEIAVQRKPEETAVSVRARSSEVWALEWEKLSAFEIDASMPREEVLSQAKTLVWEYL